MGKLLNFRQSDEDFVSICAPMVRYSKLPFRMLVRELGCDLAYSPMIMANSFVKSEKARNSEFSTCSNDRPLIVQFASNESGEFMKATEMIYKYADGVDLNCGCPQRWAIQEGVGCSLLNRPEIIADMVRTVKHGLPSSSSVVDEFHPNGFSVSVKVRLCEGEDSMKRTVELLRQLDRVGADWITVHARTASERAEPARWDFLGDVVAAAGLSCDIVVNGDVNTIEEARKAARIVNCAGVMSARGLLANPALFSPTPPQSALSTARRFIDLSVLHGSQLTQLHQHLYWMLEGSLSRSDKSMLHSMSSTASFINCIDRLSAPLQI